MMRHDNDNYSGLTYLSVCSGIEAASVAWHPLGWKAVAYSEIEKFPSAVLGHHYPDVPNLGDFTKIDTKKLGRVDILAGGTPCQAFSVAGLRQSLADARGNLSLEFVRLAHELADGNGLRNVVWENVVGVLSTKDNAFGCFLAGLVGADDAVVPGEKPADGKSNKHWRWSKPEQRHIVSWSRHGMVSGPKGRAAWAVKDAQFFGVAQRRRRVLVVADFGNGADPATVLFEPEGVLRYPPTRGEAGKDVAPTISARTKGGGGLGTDFDLDGGLRVETMAYGGNRTSGPLDVATAVNAHGGPCGRMDFESETFVAHAIQAGALRTNPNSGPDGVGVQEGLAYTLEARAEVQAVCIHADSIGRTGEAVTPSADASGVVRLRNPGMGIAADGTTYNLMASGKPHAICFTAKDYGADAAYEISPTLRSGNHSGSHANGGVMPAIAFGGQMSTPQVDFEMTQTLQAKNPQAVATASAVRRLTPTECERLQGFPDGYTDIPWRGKPNSPDGPRYKALGNSWAVPKFEWLGRRIQMLMPAKQNSQQERNFKRAA